MDPLRSDDTRITRECLIRLGIDVGEHPDGWVVDGCGGAVPGGGRLWLGESGTSLRFLLALASLGKRPSSLDGAPRLRERPVRELAQALRGLGAEVTLAETAGGLPARAGGGSLRGGVVEVQSGTSSQFASALLLLGSSLPGGLDLRLIPPAVSLPYVEVTAAVLEAFGARVSRPQRLRWVIGPGSCEGRTYRVEGDHSSASYFLAAAAMVPGRVRVEGLDPSSRQPDARLAQLLTALGVEVRSGSDYIEVRGGARLGGVRVDLTDAPDLAPTVAVLALAADGPSRLDGLAHLRLKESDRLALLAENLRAMGRRARATGGTLEIGAAVPGAMRGARIRTGSDHRLAMAFAVAGLRFPGVEIDDPHCVAKSDPDFWERFAALQGC